MSQAVTWIAIDDRAPPPNVWIFAGGRHAHDKSWYIGGPTLFSTLGIKYFLEEQSRIHKYTHWARAPSWLMRGPDLPDDQQTWIDAGYLDNGHCEFARSSDGAACNLSHGHEGHHQIHPMYRK